jgi:hypothetical protein
MLKKYVVKHICTTFAVVFHGNSFLRLENPGVVRQLNFQNKEQMFKVYVNGIRRLIS